MQESPTEDLQGAVEDLDAKPIQYYFILFYLSLIGL